MATCVTVKCNVCGNEYDFFPDTVMYILPCYKCGNDDWGYSKYWKDDKFGNFTFVSKQDITFNTNCF